MISPAVYVLVAICLAVVFAIIAGRRRSGPRDIEKARALMNALDIEAFRNLVDPEEEAFLQSSLTAQQFKSIKRERVWAAFAYARTLSHIALEFSRFGNSLSQNSDPRVADLGKRIASGAVNLRIQALAATGRLFLAAAFPALPQRSPQSLFEQYGRSAGLLVLYGLLERNRSQQTTPLSA